VHHKPSYEELERRVEELEKEMLIRTQVDEASRASEKRYRSLVETSSDLLWEIDAKGRYTYVNSTVREIFGYAPEEVVGRTPFDLMPEEEARRVGAIFAQIATERRPFSLLENVTLHPDGRRVVLETSGVPVFGPDGEFLGYRGMDRDITERKRAEDALKHSEEEKPAILNSLKTIMIEYLDPQMRMIWANNTRGRAIGQSLEDLRGKHCYEAFRGLDKPC
jgi:PAS domain S-box-containing protein